MAFKDFPSTLIVKVIETGELVAVGGVKVAKSIDLQYAQFIIYIQGALAGTEKLRAKMYADAALATAPLATSQWSSLSNIPSPGSNWIGRLLFTFNGEQMNKNIKYYFGIEPTGYTRNGETLYLSLVNDYGFAQSGNANAPWLAIYGNRWLG